MRKNPQQVAWTVLWAAFVAFCLLVTGIPLGIRSYLLNSTEDQETHLKRIEGTIQVQRSEGSQPMAVTESLELVPGDEVILDATSRGTLDLFERSHVTIYSSTSVELVDVHSPRFRVSDRPNRIALNLTGGLVGVGVALPGERGTEFEVLTPHTTVSLAEGKYRIEVTNEATQVTVVRGEAKVGAQGVRVVLSQGMRSKVDMSGVLENPLPAAQNLIENGDFQQPLSTGWITNTVVLTSEVQPPTVEVVEDGGRSAVRLSRREQDTGNHTEAAIQQRLDQDVRDFDRLEVALDVMLSFQSLSGGGQQSSEFPIIVRLDYKDLWGNDKFWTHGFYYQNEAGYPIALDPWGRPSGEEIPQGVWYPYESGNLTDLLGENRPAQITGLTVYASGWNYESLVSEIQLIVE
ncbi:MAG: FecR domain-containing protein [Anaerolineae bacterium]